MTTTPHRFGADYHHVGFTVAWDEGRRARIEDGVLTTWRVPATQEWVRQRYAAADKRDRRRHLRNRALVWASIVANFGWPIVLFNVLN